MSEYTTKKLLPVTKGTDDKRRDWCGPAVLSSITGLTTTSVILTIRKYRRQRGEEWGPRDNPVKGTSFEDMRRTLEHYGYHMRSFQYFHNKPPTLARWLRERLPEHRNHTFLVNLTRHWVLVRGNMFVDNRNTVPVTIGKSHARRRRVHAIHLITETGNVRQRPSQGKVLEPTVRPKQVPLT